MCSWFKFGCKSVASENVQQFTVKFDIRIYSIDHQITFSNFLHSFLVFINVNIQLASFSE